MSDTNNKQVYAKSISKFPYISAVTNDDLFLISKSSGGSYATYNTKIDAIVNFSEPIILDNVKERWNLGDIDVTQLNNKVSGLIDGEDDVDINSKLIFNQIPEIDSSNILGDNSVVTKSNVELMITTSESFIGADSQIDAKPNNCTNSGATDEDENLMIFRIPTNGNDSSNYKDDNGVVAESVICKHTGHLVVYGWLADKGNVLPQEAWVALCGKIKNGNESDSKWTILQVQPWNVSDRSHIIQYVGFNVPVAKDLELKIRCGFPVDDTASATNDFNTLTFKTVQPNTFVGYIIH